MKELVDVKEIRELKWDESILPLSEDRYPFSCYSDGTILSFVNYVKKFSFSTGRMSLLIKRYLGISNICPKKFIMKEAHIDINECDRFLEEEILGLGFEPDHFHTLNPPEYTRCFTMRIEIFPSNKKEVNDAHKYMKESLEKLQGIIGSIGGIYAYSELETYSNKTSRRYEFRTVDETGLTKFPFSEKEFVVTNSNYKKVDVHVKIPASIMKGKGYEGAESSEMRTLRQLFLLSGFYEIRSLSGNIIYTLQLLDIRTAKKIFFSLCSWADEHGGVTFIVMELINEFWRKEELVYGNRFRSPIPNIVDRINGITIAST